MAPAKAVAKSMSTAAFYSEEEEGMPERPLPRFSGLIMPEEPKVPPSTNGKGRGRGKKTNTEAAGDDVTPNEVQTKEKPGKKAPAGRRGAKKEEPVGASLDTDTTQPEPAENGKRSGGRPRGTKTEHAIVEVVKKTAKAPAKGRSKKEPKPVVVGEDINGEQLLTGSVAASTSSARKGRNAKKEDLVAAVMEEPVPVAAEETIVKPAKGRGKKESKLTAVADKRTNGEPHIVGDINVEQPQNLSVRKGRKIKKEEPVAIQNDEPIPEVEVEKKAIPSSTKKVEKPAKRGKRAAPAEEPAEDVNVIVEAPEESPKKKSKRDKKESKHPHQTAEELEVPQEDHTAAKLTKEQQKAAKHAAKSEEKAAKKAEKIKQKASEESIKNSKNEGKAVKAAQKAAKDEEKIAHKAVKDAEKAAKKAAKEEKKKHAKTKHAVAIAEVEFQPAEEVAVAGKRGGGRTNRKRGAVDDEEIGTDQLDPDHSQPPKNKKGLMNAVETTYDKADFCLPPAKADLFNYKISSWNVAGLRSWLKKDGLKFLEFEEPDIFCLQEIKCTEDQLPEEAARIPGYHPYWATMPGGFNGVAIYSKIMPINVEYGIGSDIFDNTGRIITAEYEHFFLINTYVPNSGRKLVNLEPRMQWEELFLAYVRKLDAKKPVIICGDMNVSHLEIDLANPKSNTRNAGFTKEERDKMTSLLAAGFVDTFRQLYPDLKGAYTFWTYMGNARARNIGWRLDYFIVSERFTGRVIENCIRAQCKGSDHCPITLFLKL